MNLYVKNATLVFIQKILVNFVEIVRQIQEEAIVVYVDIIKIMIKLNVLNAINDLIYIHMIIILLSKILFNV